MKMGAEKNWSGEVRSFELEFEDGQLKTKEKDDLPPLVGTQF